MKNKANSGSYLKFFEQGGSADTVSLLSGGGEEMTLIRCYGHFVVSLGGHHHRR